VISPTALLQNAALFLLPTQAESLLKHHEIGNPFKKNIPAIEIAGILFTRFYSVTFLL
jgi:hypothetical protein